MTEPTEATEASEHTGTVAELRDELRERDLPTSGTKDELVARLEDADAAQADEEATAGEEESDEAPAVSAGLINAAGEHNLEAIAEFGTEARALVEEILGQLEDDLIAPLADFEARHTDAAAAASVAASRAVRAHMDDVRRHLSALAVACQALATAASL